MAGLINKETFLRNQQELLVSLKGTRSTYKRLALSPIRYPGGKSLAVGYIVEVLPPIKRLISPFFGGGSIEIALSQKLDIEVIACDINEPLTNYWHFQTKHPKKLYNELTKLKPTKEEYTRIKQICKDHRSEKIELPKLLQATYFFYNHNLSYGPSYIGWASSVYLDEVKYKKMIERVRDFNGNITVTKDSFENLFTKYPKDFFYCDPPYFLKTDDESSQMFAGIYPERNNPVHHNSFDHDLLRDLLKKHNGGFILSYNNCKKSNEYYKDYQIKYPSWQYTMGQGETRISKILGNRKLDQENSHIKKSHEILIYSLAN